MSKQVHMKPPGRLKPYRNNARRHPKKQVRQIANSIETFGFNNPVLIDAKDMIICGHGRVEAAKLLGLETVPCLILDHLSDTEKRAYILADNKIAENAAWDTELLSEEFSALLELDTSFDIGLTGFEIPEIDALIDGRAPEADEDPRADDIPTTAERRVQKGDIWQLGSHRLICGDSLDQSLVCQLMNGEKARMVFTDPPYNVPIAGHVSGLGKHKHRDFEMASGEMSADAFTTFLRQAFENMVTATVDGSIHLVCMDWRHMQEILSAGNAAYTELKNLIV